MEWDMDGVVQLGCGGAGMGWRMDKVEQRWDWDGVVQLRGSGAAGTGWDGDVQLGEVGAGTKWRVDEVEQDQLRREAA